jgi:hypothetical protein
VEDGTIIGSVEHRDVLRARHDLLSAEEPQPGWLSKLRGR